MTIYSNNTCIVWNADFKPRFTRPKDVRSALNAWIRNDGEIGQGWVVDLIEMIHSLALIVPDIAVVSSCGKYVAMPAKQAATLVVDIRLIVKEGDPEYKNGPAWADVLMKCRKLKGDGVYDNPDRWPPANESKPDSD